jgi:hypothetical protein
MPMRHRRERRIDALWNAALMAVAAVLLFLALMMAVAD